jgi:hypothetical protein
MEFCGPMFEGRRGTDVESRAGHHADVGTPLSGRRRGPSCRATREDGAAEENVARRSRDENRSGDGRQPDHPSVWRQDGSATDNDFDDFRPGPPQFCPSSNSIACRDCSSKTPQWTEALRLGCGACEKASSIAGFCGGNRAVTRACLEMDAGQGRSPPSRSR